MYHLELRSRHPALNCTRQNNPGFAAQNRIYGVFSKFLVSYPRRYYLFYEYESTAGLRKKGQILSDSRLCGLQIRPVSFNLQNQL
jgi:hypothetical protein